MKSSGSFSSSFASSSDIEARSAPSRALASTVTAPLGRSRSPKGIFFWGGLADAGHRHFLDSCFLCRKSLGGNRDIYMYRGNMPFCSQECRQEQIEMDEGKETNWKHSLKASSRKDSTASATGSGGGGGSPRKSHKVHVRTDTAVAAG